MDSPRQRPFLRLLRSGGDGATKRVPEEGQHGGVRLAWSKTTKCSEWARTRTICEWAVKSRSARVFACVEDPSCQKRSIRLEGGRRIARWALELTLAPHRRWCTPSWSVRIAGESRSPPRISWCNSAPRVPIVCTVTSLANDADQTRRYFTSSARCFPATDVPEPGKATSSRCGGG
jgi:hypothetical protein